MEIDDRKPSEVTGEVGRYPSEFSQTREDAEVFATKVRTLPNVERVWIEGDDDAGRIIASYRINK